ncbi:hypothetical protein FHS95_002079 [Sphingomonas naasensis]|uniref:DUF2059 domain-containing protein n=1 Tax=Sphingomonas naasensis TaxID=1344951 RepID=A0A4S1WPM7_9SPHN|nr:DUF6683 family protein [Sphingomonas naasensis]NIJ20387.1 hypothetical protein [Sphingomonas naasensis]TGX44495.1 hypothetical protein E5A74_06875 [Sphingomonas naasensis]
MRRRLAVALAALLAMPAPAQDFSSIGNQYIDFGASMASVGQMNNVLGATVRGRSADRPASPPPRAAAPVSTRYRGAPAVSAKVRAQFADFIARADPAHAERLRQTIAAHDLLGLWEKHVATDGLRRGDVADAMAAYWVQNWQIANKVAFASRAQVQAVRGQVARSLGASPAFAKMADAERQAMAETFMLNFVAQGSAFSDAAARGDAAATARLSDAAAARFRKDVKLDLRSLKLTAAGFVG